MLCCMTAYTQPAPRSSRPRSLREAARGGADLRFHHFSFGGVLITRQRRNRDFFGPSPAISTPEDNPKE
jgi:hypothetical protein